MRKLLVRILFKNTNHALEVIMTENEAQSFIKKWREASSDLGRVGGYDAGIDRYWAADAGEICAILTFDKDRLEDEARKQQQLAQQGKPSTPPLWGGSGRN